MVHVAHVLQDRHEVLKVMTVDGAHIIEPHLLEEGAAGEHRPAVLFPLSGELVEALGKLLHELLREIPEALINARGGGAREVGGHGAHRRSDRHVVIVQDDDEFAVRGTRIVHRFIGHACGHGAVADHRDGVTVLALEVPADGHAEGGGDRCGSVGRAERVVFAFRALGEAGKAAALA